MPSLVLARIRVPVLSFRIALQPTTQRRYWFLVDSGMAPESVSPGAREIGIHISPGGANSLGRTSFVSKKLEAIIELNVLFSGEPRSLNSRREATLSDREWRNEIAEWRRVVEETKSAPPE